jgi:hypothetical protein
MPETALEVNVRRLIMDALYDWAAEVIADCGRSEPVIWLSNNGPRPLPPFIGLEFLGGGRNGQPWKSRMLPSEDGDVEQHLLYDEKRALVMHGYGEESFDMLSEILDSIDKEKYRAMLFKQGLVIPYALDVVDASMEISNVMENHDSFDFYVTYNRIAIDKPGCIEHVIITPEGIPMDVIGNTNS